MKFYAYLGSHELGKEPVGGEGRLLFELKTVRGAKRRCDTTFKGKPYRLFVYTNVYKLSTYKEVA